MRRLVLPVLVLACLLGACDAPTTSVPTTTVPSAATPTRLPSVVLPPRPRDIDMSGVDLCTLVTDQQRRELDLDRPWVRNEYSEPLYGNNPVRTCGTRSTDRGTDLGLTLSDRVGIEAWTTQDVNATVTSASVDGFPAITAIPGNKTSPFCTVAVDVAPHTVLEAQFGAIGSPLPSQAELCADAHRSAELAMTTLTTTLGR